MTAFVLRVVVSLAVVAALVVAGFAVASALQPPMVPCAHWAAAHPWCQGPAGVTP